MAAGTLKSGLTSKQELFCRKYIECRGNASEAYRQAYDCRKSTQTTIATEASKLVQNPHVAQMIDKLRADMQQELKYTIEDAMHELQDAIEFAKQNGQASAVISAIGKKIDMFGLDAPKKVNVEGTLGEWLASMQDKKK